MSDCTKGVLKRLVRSKKMNENELLMTYRKPLFMLSKLRAIESLITSLSETCLPLLESISDRIKDCKLTVHPEKLKVIYCKSANRTWLVELLLGGTAVQFENCSITWT